MLFAQHPATFVVGFAKEEFGFGVLVRPLEIFAEIRDAVDGARVQLAQNPASLFQ